MKYAILAAGEGSRLQNEGITTPKPLIRVSGECLVDRLVRIFISNDAEEIVIITNDIYPEIAQHIRDLIARGLPLRLVVKTTPSSMHSFHALAPLLGEGKFCLTTVDTIFDEAEFSEYIRRFELLPQGGLMAVTDYIDDEKPLYVGVNTESDITGFYDTTPSRFVSGGIYCLDHGVFPILERCISTGQSRMRNFQRALVSEGYPLVAHPFSRIMDIDHVSDIVKAQAVYREPEYSGNPEADRAIMDKVLERFSLLPAPCSLLPNLILSMARSPEKLEQLRRLKAQGYHVINDPDAVALVSRRENLFWLTGESYEPTSFPLWVKPAGYSRQKDDVVFVEREEDLPDVLEKLKNRGITDVVYSPHHEGRHVKFYGIGGALLDVYGGDAIVSPDGEVHIIDINDWPSFSPCLDEAAQAIVSKALSS